MLETLAFHALDSVTNPIIVCEPDGTVLYKNGEAEKRLQVPHLKKKLIIHLSKESRALLKNYKSALPSFIDYTSDGEIHSAFVDIVYYEARPVILFFFSHLFDFAFTEKTKLLQPEAIAEKLSGNKIVSLAIRSYKSVDLPLALRNRTGHIVATRVFRRLFSTVLTELYYGGETVLYSLDYANEIIAYAARNILSRFGLDVLFPILDKTMASILIDFKPFSLLLSNLLTMLAEITVTPTASVRVIDEGDTVLYEITGSIKDEHKRVFVGGVEAFSEILPGCALDLYTFDILCKNQSFRFDFTVKEASADNLILRLRAPIERKYTVHERMVKDKANLFAIIEVFAEKLEKNLDDFAALRSDEFVSL